MPLTAAILVYVAILLPCILYVWIALKERRHVKSLAEFFPLTRHLEGGAYSRSTVSAGVSLATVILALVNLAPFLGLSLFVTIASYVTSFILLRWSAGVILAANPSNDTLQGWLGMRYASSPVRLTATIFSFVGYVSIFSMELLVGVTVLEPFLGKGVIAFAFVYLLFMIAYSLISGFRAIVAVEQWQFRFVVLVILVLVAFVPLLAFSTNQVPPMREIFGGLLTQWNAPWAFVIGIVFMNAPAAFADAATWQRLCATRSVDDARRGLARAIPWFVVIWGGLIVCASLISAIATRVHAFDPAKGTLMTFLVSALARGGTFHLVLLFLFILGLFSAMINTADSLLLVSAQMFTQDFCLIRRDSPVGLRVARASLAIIGLLSFGLFALFQWLQFDVVQLIFAIYGAHISLFPAVIAALFLKQKLTLPRASVAAWASASAGFLGGWGAATYGKLSGHSDWLYNAPVVSLIVAVVVFTLAATPAIRRRPIANS
jgi:Na+/proline symporter